VPARAREEITMSGLAQDLQHILNLKVGVFDAYWAVEDTLYTAPAPAWNYFGVCAPGSLQAKFPREAFKYQNGLPRATKAVAIIKTDGMIDFTLDEYTDNAVEIAAGSGPQVRTYATTTPAPTTIASLPTVNGATLTSGTGFAYGQQIEIGMPNGLTALVRVDTVAGAVVTWKPALPVAPLAAATVKAVKSVQQALGSKNVARLSIKLVYTDEFGEFVTIHVPACTEIGNFTPAFRDMQNMQLPMQFEAYAKAAVWNGASENICAYVYHDYPNVT
jgi:hypothetical protein